MRRVNENEMLMFKATFFAVLRLNWARDNLC